MSRRTGFYPVFERQQYLEGAFIRTLPDDLRDGIARFGVRNSHLTAIAPTGTISLLADNLSSGLEPVFRFQFTRRVLQRDGRHATHSVQDPAWRLWQEGHPDQALPEAFLQADDLEPEAHLVMQAALQPYVDSAMSKTVNVPQDMPFERFKAIYRRAHALGLKGCTTFRPNSVTGAVLESAESATPCCDIEREND